MASGTFISNLVRNFQSKPHIMKHLSITFLFATAIIFSSCKNENQSAEDRVQERTDMTQQEEPTNQEANERIEIRVEMEAKSGSDLQGEATFVQENGEVTLTATFSGLSEGTHAIHLHENADCSADDGTSAGGHWNPTFEDHGEWGDDTGYHKGDIGNFEVDADGNGSVTFTTDQWCIGCDDDTKNIIGTSLIVHDGTDDFTSQPSGNAGTRIGCGVIER